MPCILRRIGTRLPTCRSVACGDLLTVEKFTCSSCQRHPWFQDPSCYACSCLSCNFAREPNRSPCEPVTIPRVEDSGAFSSAIRRILLPQKLVSGTHPAGACAAKHGDCHCCFDASPAGLPTLPEVCRIC